MAQRGPGPGEVLALQCWHRQLSPRYPARAPLGCPATGRGDKPKGAHPLLLALSQALTVRSSKYMVFDKKSIPMVAC